MKKLCLKMGSLVFAAFLLAGCQTAKGLSKGVAIETAGAAYGVAYTAQGMVEDAYSGVVGTHNVIMSTDKWIRENAW